VTGGREGERGEGGASGGREGGKQEVEIKRVSHLPAISY